MNYILILHYILIIIIIGLIILLAIQLLGGWERICDPYRTDSICFNVDFRCQVECGNYDWNSYGIIKGTCRCDCGDNIVSFCSGFAFPKIGDKNVV